MGVGMAKKSPRDERISRNHRASDAPRSSPFVAECEFIAGARRGGDGGAGRSGVADMEEAMIGGEGYYKNPDWLCIHKSVQ